MGVSGPTCDSCGAASGGSFVFDVNGNQTQRTDANGNATNYTYDASGNVASRSVPLANGTTQETGLSASRKIRSAVRMGKLPGRRLLRPGRNRRAPILTRVAPVRGHPRLLAVLRC